MKINPIGHLVKTNPNKPNFKGKKMLLRLTINGRRESFGYYAGNRITVFVPVKREISPQTASTYGRIYFGSLFLTHKYK